VALIEESIRTMLITGSTLSAAGVPDDRVTHGYRLQETDLPAVTFEVTGTADADTGGLNSSNVSFNIVASTTLAAGDLVATLKSRLVVGTFNSNNVDAIVILDETVNPPAVGFGDEQEPATATVNTVIYWS
jgi:hypothetical protein